MTRDTRALVLTVAAIAALTVLYRRVLDVQSAATISTTFVLVVLIAAATSRLWVAVVASVVAMLAFNFFFLPPVGTLTIADPQNWVALLAFLGVSLVGSKLSADVRSREQEAVARRNEMARLFDLSRDVLLTTDSTQAIPLLARSISRRFDMPYVGIALPHGPDWEVSTAGAESVEIDERELTAAFATAQTVMEFDATARTYAGHRTTTSGGQTVQLVPLRSGTKPVGVLATTGRLIEPGVLDGIAGIAAIGIERARLLDEHRRAELARQSDRLKAALLASIGHDLRTPLTSIRLAASNLKGTALADGERDEQIDLILGEVERLKRLFQNILDMARLEAGAIQSQARWVHPSEIIDGAHEQVSEAVRGRKLNVSMASDIPIQTDPRLAAAALAQVLENAAHYTPADSPIDLGVAVDGSGTTFTVRDHGPGIALADLPHLFERFYRGDAATTRSSGTGTGLWIARRMLAVQGGRIWAENCPDGGARFTLHLPAQLAREPVDNIEEDAG